MTELKTLKDLEKSTEYFKWGCDSFQVCLEDLKAEAVKWVKADNWDNLYKNIKFKGISPELTIEWIKHFFNLTEEDLK